VTIFIFVPFEKMLLDCGMHVSRKG